MRFRDFERKWDKLKSKGRTQIVVVFKKRLEPNVYFEFTYGKEIPDEDSKLKRVYYVIILQGCENITVDTVENIKEIL